MRVSVLLILVLASCLVLAQESAAVPQTRRVSRSILGRYGGSQPWSHLPVGHPARPIGINPDGDGLHPKPYFH
ncbi:hypothetical protein B566_EDAN009176 [Ephemera danica]|nr:hypothetical protein B566_EDAN009176 [Ephemera danica]